MWGAGSKPLYNKCSQPEAQDRLRKPPPRGSKLCIRMGAWAFTRFSKGSGTQKSRVHVCRVNKSVNKEPRSWRMCTENAGERVGMENKVYRQFWKSLHLPEHRWEPCFFDNCCRATLMNLSCVSVCECVCARQRERKLVYVLRECVFKVSVVFVSGPDQFLKQVFKTKQCLRHSCCNAHPPHPNNLPQIQGTQTLCCKRWSRSSSREEREFPRKASPIL